MMHGFSLLYFSLHVIVYWHRGFKALSDMTMVVFSTVSLGLGIILKPPRKIIKLIGQVSLGPAIRFPKHCLRENLPNSKSIYSLRKG